MAVPVQRILVGVDGSRTSQDALAWAVDLAAACGAEVVAVHAVGLLESIGGDPVPSNQHRDEIARMFEDVWCSPLQERPHVASRTLLEDGPPTMVLLRVAAAEEVDLLVVGSRGAGGFPDLLLGSTSTGLAQHAPVPVTIVPAAERRGGADEVR